MLGTTNSSTMNPMNNKFILNSVNYFLVVKTEKSDEKIVINEKLVLSTINSEMWNEVNIKC